MERGLKKNILYFILFCGSCLYWVHINSSGPFMHFNSVALSRRSTYFICNPLYLEPEILACQGKWQERGREGGRKKEKRERERKQEREREREGEKNTRAQCEFPRTSENCSAAQNSEVISSSTACDGPCRACVCVCVHVCVYIMFFMTGLWHSIGRSGPAWKHPSHHLTFPNPPPLLPYLLWPFLISTFNFCLRLPVNLQLNYIPAKRDEAIVGPGAAKTFTMRGGKKPTDHHWLLSYWM